jgi:hypothetical protein
MRKILDICDVAASRYVDVSQYLLLLVNLTQASSFAHFELSVSNVISNFPKLTQNVIG